MSNRNSKVRIMLLDKKIYRGTVHLLISWNNDLIIFLILTFQFDMKKYISAL